MPSIKDKSTVEAIARAFISNGRIKSAALKTVGYKPSYYNAGRSVQVVYGNERVLAAIARIDDKTVAEMDLSRKAQYQRLLDIHDKTDTVGSVKVSCLREINEMLGYHRDKAPNTERQTQIRERMDAEELIYRQEHTLKRTITVSRQGAAQAIESPDTAQGVLGASPGENTPTEPTQDGPGQSMLNTGQGGGSERDGREHDMNLPPTIISSGTNNGHET